MPKKHVDREEFKQMWLAYASISDICTHFEIGKKYMREIRDELGLSPRKTRFDCRRPSNVKTHWYDLQRYQWDEFDYEKFERMYNDGVGRKRIRAHFDISNYVFYRIRDKLGLPPTKSTKPVEINVEEFNALIEQGKNPTEICISLGISRSSVYMFAKRNGIKIGDPVVPIDLSKLRELNEQGLSDTEIARILGCSDSNASVWRCRLGLLSTKSRRFNLRLRRREIVAEDQQPEVKSEESLYCSTEFLESYFGKKLDD